MERLFARGIAAAVLAGTLSLLALVLATSPNRGLEVSAQVVAEPGFSLSPEVVNVGIGDRQTLEVVSGEFDTTDINALQVTVQYDSTKVRVENPSCLDDLADMHEPRFNPDVQNGAASFTCFEILFPGNGGLVATFDVVAISVDDSDLELVGDGPFSTGYFGDGALMAQGDLTGATVAVQDGDTVRRSASATIVEAGDEVTITITPDGEMPFYAVREDLAGLELISHTADNFSEGAFVMISATPFEYVVRVPADADPGEQFPITGNWWEDPGFEFLVLPDPLVIEVAEPVTPTPTPEDTPTPTAVPVSTNTPVPPTPTTAPSGGGGGGGGGGGAPPSGPTSTPLPAIPTAPQSVTAEPGDGSVTINWSPPPLVEGAPVTGYRILNTVTGTAVLLGGSALSHTFTGLTNGISYSFQISAINSSGNGESVVVGPVTPIAGSGSGAAVGAAASGAFGEGVEVTESDPEISTEPSGIRALIPATGVSEGETPTGEFDIDTEELTVDTDSSGAGTGSLKLGEELTVTGQVQVIGAEGGIAVEFQDATLNFIPVIDETESTLLDEDVGTPEVSFDVGVTGVGESTQVSAEYTKELPSEFAGSSFALGAPGTTGQLDDPDADIAYVVSVSKSGIDDEDLQDNTVTMTVGKTWYEERVAAGKSIVISKVAEDGSVFVVEPVCTELADSYSCTATFSGEAGGFSDFILAALTLTTEPTPTPTPTPSPTPIPTGVPTFQAPDDQPTQEPSPTETVVPPTPTTATGATQAPAATATATLAPTSVSAPTPTPLPQILPTPAADGDGDGGGGLPAWVIALIGVLAVGILGGIVARTFGSQILQQLKRG